VKIAIIDHTTHHTALIGFDFMRALVGIRPFFFFRNKVSAEGIHMWQRIARVLQ